MTPRAPPALPDPPTTANRLLESRTNTTATTVSSTHDADGDGIPDALDAVNLGSEAQALTSSQDHLALVEGLPQAGFALLIEPSHREAQLVVADPASIVSAAATPTAAMTAQQALNQIELLQGVEARNALAMVLNSGMSLRYTPIAPEAPWNLTLAWSHALAADGSWLLVSTDPTRLLDLTLAGQGVSLAARATSHFSSTLNFTDFRWQFLNLHSGENFCYDPATFQNGTDCLGNKWPGWIRAFSGQAAYALESVRAGLAAQAIPLTTPLPPATQRVVVDSCDGETVGVVANGLFACAPSSPGLPAPTPPCLPGEVGKMVDIEGRCKNLPIQTPPIVKDRLFPIDSPCQPLGTSYAMPTGIGTDYLLDPTGLASQASRITQVSNVMLNDTRQIVPAAQQRLFRFEGAYHSTPTEPRNVTLVRLGIDSLDGNHGAQTFLIDGKRLQQLLELQGNDTFRVDIDERHRDGFAWIAADVNGDGAKDLVIHVPHFSQAWLDIGNDNTHDVFYAVKMTSANTGWLTGYKGVYRYASGHLTLYQVTGVGNAWWTALSVVNDHDFYVAGSGDAGGCYGPAVAHYHSVTYAQYAFTV
ncbi:MAG: hypothetical protein LC623_06605, partial [Halobacteriales archaeon]|nr:hypothetical protein [Halobacteriales archaeon]